MAGGQTCCWGGDHSLSGWSLASRHSSKQVL